VALHPNLLTYFHNMHTDLADWSCEGMYKCLW